MMRVLRTITVPETTISDLWIDGDVIMSRERGCIASADQDCYARAARFALDAAPFTGKTIAWIGGGLCVGPRLFAMVECTQDVYEIEVELKEFCPPGVAFAAGDWRDTLKAKYDVIIYDLGGETPAGELSKFLRPGGMILPKGVGSSP